MRLVGDEMGCRLRQLVLLGQRRTGPTSKQLRPSTSHQLLFSQAQMDAFLLFQAIAAQVHMAQL